MVSKLLFLLSLVLGSVILDAIGLVEYEDEISSTLLAVLDPFLAISEDFNFKFNRGRMPRTPLVGSR